MKRFELPEFEAGKTFLEYLLDPKKLKDTLERLQALVDEINAKMSAVGAIEDVEAMRAQIRAKLDETNDIRRHADEVRREADELLLSTKDSANAIILKATTDATTVKWQADQELAKARDHSTAVAELSALTLERQKAAEQKMAEALRLMQEAEQTKQRYERKLQAYREAEKV